MQAPSQRRARSKAPSPSSKKTRYGLKQRRAVLNEEKDPLGACRSRGPSLRSG